VRSIACTGTGADGPFLDGDREQQGDRYLLRFRRSPDFPDRLRCQLGDEDLLPRAPGPSAS
jgi:hypothetical protein